MHCRVRGRKLASSVTISRTRTRIAVLPTRTPRQRDGELPAGLKRAAAPLPERVMRSGDHRTLVRKGRRPSQQRNELFQVYRFRHPQSPSVTSTAYHLSPLPLFARSRRSGVRILSFRSLVSFGSCSCSWAAGTNAGRRELSTRAAACFLGCWTGLPKWHGGLAKRSFKSLFRTRTLLPGIA